MIAEVNSPALIALDDESRHDKIIDLISEIKLVTGALLYPDESAEQLLQLNVIKKFLCRSPKYLRLHTSEITQAFYMNASGAFSETYRHYNRELNTEFIGDVLNAYINWKARFLALKLPDIRRALFVQPSKPRILLDDAFWMADINRDLEYLRDGRPWLIWNTTQKYALMRRAGYISMPSRAAWWRWYGFTIEILRNEKTFERCKTEPAKREKKRMLEMYDEILREGIIPSHKHRIFVTRLRRVIYLHHAQAVAACGILDLFKEVSP